MIAMRILANENFPGPVVSARRSQGHDVVWVKESMRGAADSDVLQRSQADNRILVTFDKDLGELAYRSRLSAGCGVVLFRLAGASPDEDNARVLAALTSRHDWSGLFAVVLDDRIRVRELPPPSHGR